METKRIFLSHKMNGLSESEVKKIRREAMEYLCQKYGRMRFIDNYTHQNAPANAGRLWHLGRSIQQIEKADAVYFVKGHCNSKGCIVERIVCWLYGKKVIK